MSTSVQGHALPLPHEYFLTDHVCNADRQKAEAAAGMEATESNMQTRAASALESVIQEDGNDKEHEFQIAKQLPI